MTQLDKIRQMNDDELISFFTEIADGCGDMVWDNWFNEEYCNKCQTFEVETEWGTCTEAFCEHNHYCPYAEQKNSFIDTKQVVKMWLSRSAAE